MLAAVQSRAHAADRQRRRAGPYQSMSLKRAQLFAHRPRHCVGLVVETLAVRRRVGRFEIAPALEGAAGLRPRGDELGVEHDAATARAVVPRLLAEIEHALPHQHEALDHPVERAAVEDFVAPPRGLEGAMAMLGLLPRPGEPLEVVGLPLGEFPRRFDADAKLDQMQRHGPSLEVTNWTRLLAREPRPTLPSRRLGVRMHALRARLDPRYHLGDPPITNSLPRPG